jgi:hypothetical protein
MHETIEIQVFLTKQILSTKDYILQLNLNQLANYLV